MDARQHYAAAEALLIEGRDSGNWQYYTSMAGVAATHIAMADLNVRAEQAGLEPFGQADEPVEPESPQE